DFDAVLKVHLYGGFNCCRHALPVMKEQKYGRIINIVSSAGLRGNFGQANYGAAKAGLMGLTFVIAVEHMKGNAEGKYSITANAPDAPGGSLRVSERRLLGTARVLPTFSFVLGDAQVVVSLHAVAVALGVAAGGVLAARRATDPAPVLASAAVVAVATLVGAH